MVNLNSFSLSSSTSTLHRSDDALFYDAPRFVTHIDDAAIASLTEFYSRSFPASGTPGTALLDLCSSWISHFPKNYRAGRVVGLGMNAEELKRNTQLTESVVQDLNKDPRLPFEVRDFEPSPPPPSFSFFPSPSRSLSLFFSTSKDLSPSLESPKKIRTNPSTSSPTA